MESTIDGRIKSPISCVFTMYGGCKFPAPMIPTSCRLFFFFIKQRKKNKWKKTRLSHVATNDKKFYSKNSVKSSFPVRNPFKLRYMIYRMISLALKSGVKKTNQVLFSFYSFGLE